MQQPLHRTLRRRRRYWLIAAPRRCVIDDQLGLPGYIGLEAAKHADHLARRRSLRRRRLGHSLELHQGFADEIESPPHLTMPETPMDMLDCVGKAGTFLTLGQLGIRPALGGLSDMLNAHGEMKPIEYVVGRTDACRLAQGTRTVGAVAQDGDRRVRCRPKVKHHPAQLLRLPIGLGRHAAEHDLVAFVIADLRDENLEGPCLIAAHRFHVSPVDGECDRLRFGRGSRRRWRHRLPLEAGADMQGPLADRLHLRGVAEREELFEKRAGTAIWQQGAHLGDGAFILRRAAVGHDLCDRGDGPARRHAASAGTKTGGTNLHGAKQRRQPSGTDVLERALRTTMLAATSAPAMLLCLRLDQMALQPGQRLLALRHRQSKRLCRIGACRALADADLAQLKGTLRSAQFHHDPPLHLALPAQRQQVAPYTPKLGRSGPIMPSDGPGVRFTKQRKSPQVLDGLCFHLRERRSTSICSSVMSAIISLRRQTEPASRCSWGCALPHSMARCAARPGASQAARSSSTWMRATTTP